MYINGVKERLKLESKKKIAIIGAGPGGLAAGMLLSQLGYQVNIYEKMIELVEERRYTEWVNTHLMSDLLHSP